MTEERWWMHEGYSADWKFVHSAIGFYEIDGDKLIQVIPRCYEHGIAQCRDRVELNKNLVDKKVLAAISRLEASEKERAKRAAEWKSERDEQLKKEKRWWKPSTWGY